MANLTYQIQPLIEIDLNDDDDDDDEQDENNMWANN